MESVDSLLTNIDRSKPILLVDADEVLLQFVIRLEEFCLGQGFELRLTSFKLAGNIYERATGDLAPPHQVKEMLANFFSECVEDMAAVPGAAQGLAELSQYYQIAILTNVPRRNKTGRRKNLAQLGMDYPVIANKGDKGPIVKLFSEATEQPTIFMDDLPPQHSSVAAHCPESHRIHFVADPRLADMIGKAPDADVRIDTWRQVKTHLISRLEI